jgi:hypothetical protein
MDSPRTGSHESDTVQAPFVRDGNGMIGDATRVARPVLGTYPGTEVGENVMPVRNRVQWGPVIAGLATAIATFLLMTVLGIAVGASVLDPADSGSEIGTWAAVWGAISAILAFFLGGWIAAKSAAVGGSFAGLLNGFMVGAAGLVLILWLTGTGLGNLFGTLSSNLGDVINVAQETAQQEGVTTDEAQTEADQAVDNAAAAIEDVDSQSTFDDVRDGAFGSFLGLLLPLVAAALGGWLGHNTRRELIQGTG